MSTPDTSHPATQAQIFSLGWRDGEPDKITPAMRRRIEAMGLGAQMAGQHDDEPLDAA